MTNNQSPFWTFFFIFMFINSIFYFSLKLDENQNLSHSVNSDFLDPNKNSNSIPDDSLIAPSFPIKKIEIPGDYQIFGYFPYKYITPNLYPDGEGYEWVDYDTVKDNGSEIIYQYFSISPQSFSQNWPSGPDEYIQAVDAYLPSHRNATMYSPVFEEDYLISGKAYFRFNVHRHFNLENDWVEITLRINLSLYNPADYNTTPILTIESILPSADGGQYYQNMAFSDTFSEPVVIPAGYRLKQTLEAKFNDTSVIGHLMFYVQDGIGEHWDWLIDDDPYSAFYRVYEVDWSRYWGTQLYMRSNAYPDINIYGVNNETVYNEDRVITIDVTDGSDSYYKWDGNPFWVSFENSTITSFPKPLTHGWHYLEIKASDPIFNNTKVSIYKLGYDASTDNILLHNALSGDYLEGGFILNFSVYDVDSVIYEWDNSGSWLSLTDPYDITTPLFNGWHDLTINTTDFYETNSYTYTFFFDSDTPVITLTNAANNSYYVPGKYLEFLITDTTGLTSLNYSWDSGTIQSWTPHPGNTYSTNLPTEVGSHYLEIFAIDGHNHSAYAYYQFYSDQDTFNVDLLNLVENKYYKGNNTVELIVQRSNGTCYFKWDGGTEKLGTLVGTYLTLDGTDALPISEGLHTLNIKTFNLSNIEFLFSFSFFVDNTAPIISNLQSYDGGRYLDIIEIQIFIEDNFADNSTELTVEYSLDGKIYQSLEYSFLFSYPYIDGIHTLDIRAQDLAGNIGNYTISFIIDSTPPTIDVTINGLIDRTSIDGHFYIPPNSLVEIIVYDTDPAVTVEYKWRSSSWILVNGENFTLSSLSDGIGILRIRAYDSLNNEDDSYSITLVYDSTPPNVIMNAPSINSRINDVTSLQFTTNDYTLQNINYMEYYWDEAVSLGSVEIIADSKGRFDISMGIYLLLYNLAGYKFANLTIYAEDILGNNDSYIFNFEIDDTPPVLALEYFNGTMFVPMIEDETYEAPGGATIRYDNATCDDLLSFDYYWEFDDPTDPNHPNSTWEFDVPDEDGIHYLMVILADSTGEGSSPNIVIANYTFIVDDIEISYLYPLDFTNDYYYEMVYNETFVYRVNVTDKFTKEPISNLNYLVDYDKNLNLTIYINQTGILSEYEIIIISSNITFPDITSVSVNFYQMAGGGDTVNVYLQIRKKEGILTIVESDLQITYEDDLEILLKLQNDLEENQTIMKLFVNDSFSHTFREITNFEFDPITSFCTFYFSSYWIGKKGNFSLDISAESSYYFGNTTTGTTLDFEILPLPIILTISVSNYTILEGTDLGITLALTFLNGTPVTYEDVNLYIHIVLKNVTQPSLSFALEEVDYTENYILETDFQGRANKLFTLTKEISYIIVEGRYNGTDTQGSSSFILEEIIITIPPPEPEVFPRWLLYTIIASSIFLIAIISFIVYKLTRPKSFEQLMEEVTNEEMALNYSIVSPGVVLSIFDQSRGPVPLVSVHSFEVSRYRTRLKAGIENFLLKISDQAYSSLGFEELDQGRRVGSIKLPVEKMIALVHGIMLPNKAARGGFENLTLIVLADSEHGIYLLNYQEYLYDKIDVLIKALEAQKELNYIKELLSEIRDQSVIIMLAAQKTEKSDAAIIQS